MSLTQLQAIYQPWFNKRSLKRELKTAQSKTKRLAKAKIRRAKSKSLAAVRSQYYLATAYADARTAVRHNEDIVITTLILAAVLGYSVAATALNLLIIAFSASFAASELLNIEAGLFMLLTGAALGLICSWITAFVINMQSLALMDGAVRKTRRSVRSTVRKGLRHATGVTNAWMLVLAIVAGIPALAVYAMVSYVSLGSLSVDQVFAYVPYVTMALIAWMVIMLMEYALVPYIVLFESGVTLRRAMARSHQLIARKGRIFILALSISAGAAIFGAYKLAALLESLIGLHQGLQFAAYSLTVLLAANAAMVMLYRKRKLVRKN